MDDPACSCTTPVPAHGHLRGRQRHKLRPRALRLVAAGAAAAAALAACGGSDDDDATTALREQGRQIFRHDTFGDERLWTDTLRLHEVVAAAVDPTTAGASPSPPVQSAQSSRLLPIDRQESNVSGSGSSEA